MIKETYYQYLGKNGIISSPIELEGINSIKKIKLTPEDGKQLTKNGETFVDVVVVPESEVSLWREVKR